MISRLTAFAALFAVLATTSIAVAATVQQRQAAMRAATPVVVLDRVTVIGHRQATPSL